MPDLVAAGSKTLPLEATTLTCWRCGGPAGQRAGLLRFDPCPTCTAMLQEVQARYEGRQQPEDAGG